MKQQECQQCSADTGGKRTCSECDDVLCDDCCLLGPDGDICDSCLTNIEKSEKE